MSLILDMSKAYDRVEWGFLEKVLVTLGFKPNLIKVNMNCVNLASFSIFINEIPKGYIKPSRGLR